MNSDASAYVLAKMDIDEGQANTAQRTTLSLDAIKARTFGCGSARWSIARYRSAAIGEIDPGSRAAESGLLIVDVVLDVSRHLAKRRSMFAKLSTRPVVEKRGSVSQKARDTTGLRLSPSAEAWMG